ncbi:MAG TPA: type I phosphomannose isomerase catalytic subunit [Planctomycetaceae bacterium]|jgi:mannose-6-phosphate isomerase|nr:type I phosphomannose isomerase catalytic subunit [Planctomycetaceae bacterium]
MQPLQFHPVLKRIRWGGRRLGTVLGKPIGDASDYAESWEIADCGDDQSTVAEGPFNGWTLARLVAAEGTALFGRDRGPAHFPLLIKFLDCNDRLSVQVHPNDEQARQMGRGDNGKTEAWVILEAKPDSRIYAGLKPGVDRRSLEKHLDAGTVEECLHSFPARRGDCIFVPAGTVHALGEGILLVETQQSSDVTFRLFDWGRLGADGKPRPLHRDESLACIDFDRGPVNPVVPRVVANRADRTEELVRCDYFVLRRHTLSHPLSLDADRRFHVLLPLAGQVDVRADDYQKRLRLGDTLLAPAAATGVTLTPAGEAVVLEISAP